MVQCQRELQEIVAGVDQEKLLSTSSWSDFCSGITGRRVITGMGLQMFQMLTGINSVMCLLRSIISLPSGQFRIGVLFSCECQEFLQSLGRGKFSDTLFTPIRQDTYCTSRYYAPAIFGACGFDTAEQLLATGGTGVVNFLATFLAFWLLDRVGRRTLLVTGAIGMAISMATLAALGMVYGEVSGSSSGSDSTGQPQIESRTVGYM